LPPRLQLTGDISRGKKEVVKRLGIRRQRLVARPATYRHAPRQRAVWRRGRDAGPRMVPFAITSTASQCSIIPPRSMGGPFVLARVVFVPVPAGLGETSCRVEGESVPSLDPTSRSIWPPKCGVAMGLKSKRNAVFTANRGRNASLAKVPWRYRPVKNIRPNPHGPF